MATVECRECGGRISSKARSCPHCGGRPIDANPEGELKRVFTVVAVGIGILILIYIGISSLAGSSSSSPSFVYNAKFSSMLGCLRGIESDSGLSLNIISDDPENVSGYLGSTKRDFGCQRKVTGSQGVYYKGWYLSSSKMEINKTKDEYDYTVENSYINSKSEFKGTTSSFVENYTCQYYELSIRHDGDDNFLRVDSGDWESASVSHHMEILESIYSSNNWRFRDQAQSKGLLIDRNSNESYRCQYQDYAYTNQENHVKQKLNHNNKKEAAKEKYSKLLASIGFNGLLIEDRFLDNNHDLSSMRKVFKLLSSTGMQGLTEQLSLSDFYSLGGSDESYAIDFNGASIRVFLTRKSDGDWDAQVTKQQ